jgi:hypothetical protein
VGFEPTDALRASRFSKPLPWASRAPLQFPLPCDWGGRTRTCDPRINSPMLCQLSYAPSPAAIARGPTKNLPRAKRSELPLQGSNLDFPDPESGVLPVTPRGSLVPVPYSRVYAPRAGRKTSGRRGSNPRPSAWEADALPTELLPRSGASRAGKDKLFPGISPEPPVRIELTTARLRIECSTAELRWRRPAKRVEPRGIEPLTSAVRLQRSPI